MALLMIKHAGAQKSISRGSLWRRMAEPAGRFGRDRSGASALEFAIVATPLILALLAILQVSLVYFANFALEGAIDRGARLIRTGQAQTQKFNAQQFKAEVCKHLSAPLRCDNLMLDVRSYPSFAGAAGNLAEPPGSDGKPKDYGFNPGAAEDVVVVRGFYPLDIGSALPSSFSLSNLEGGGRLLTATAAFRNEPFK